MKNKNTKQKGLLRFFIYFDKKTQEYVGVCVELSIIKTGENPYVVEEDLIEAAMGYVEIVCRDENLSSQLLNQNLPPKYLHIYNKIQNIADLNTKKVPSDNTISIDDTRTFAKIVPQLCPVT